MIHRILNQFSFKGRITRGQYVVSLIIFYVFVYPLTLIEKHYELSEDGKGIVGLFIIPFIIFILVKGARRCHDRGNSGLYQFIPGYFFFMVFGDSDYGVNKYGPNSKGEGNDTFNTTTDQFQNALMSTMLHSDHFRHCGHQHCSCNKRK
ncbi:DUF805 domain-containing protein [Chryseobacterium arthrosphaerae]|uniref:DUF805 domain-containing protein n=1 Tax=Chryseobacterium arthrosphaerae TaxID=651561 RepID=UPI001F4B4392|nr:DUF805 domain-containing protein [Chryseobacterium arthrosphaerae]